MSQDRSALSANLTSNEPTWYELEINRLKAVIESLKEDKKKLVAEIFELSLENTATLEYYTENNDLNS